MKLGAALTAVVVVAAVGVGAYDLFASASPYMTAKQARTQPGVTCNVAGDLMHDTVRSDLTNGLIRFEIKDTDGDVLPVVYKGSKPGNFDSAPRVSVLGTFQGDAFQAERILVKCPSKYETTGSGNARKRS